jgi:adenosylcobinamide-phosphate synthase
VADALAQHDLATARQKLSWIVSRETQLLNEQQIAQASVETTLENSSDAVFASLFWFALGGAAFSLLHRWLNTLDAMWGYKNEQFLYFGRIAARLDDAMNYIPARLTALCFVVLSPRRQQTTSGAAGNLAWYCWRTQARQCASPNGGVVMTAGAGALNCRLSDGAYYHGHWQAKPPMGCGAEADGDDIAAALTLVKRAVGVFLLAWLLLGLALLVLEFTGSAYV